MKIVIATFCLGYNYGAMLQSYATVKVLESLGHEALLLNQHQPWSFGLNEKYWRNYISLSPKIMFYKWTKLLNQRTLRKCFKPMWESFPLTKYYGTDINAIIADPPQCDCLLTGSDQTWNTSADRCNYAVYFLPFHNTNIKRISYAPSLGGTRFKEKDIPWIVERLKSYSSVSVREKQDLEYLRSIGIENVEQMPDPTLIADQSIYEEFIKDENHHSYDAVLYILGSKDVKMNNKLKQLIDESNINLSNTLNIKLQDYKCKGAINKTVTVQKWVDAIANTKIVITNSFHAVVFSLIFNKPFVYINFPEYADSKNNRVRTLLEDSEQSFRMVDIEKLEDFKLYTKNPNFDSELIKLRDKGIKYLTNVLSV